MPIHLKRKNGEVTPYKSSEFIPAYYFIPKEAMTKLPRELQELPRNPWFIFRDWDAVAVVESDLFLQLMIDGFAQFFFGHERQKKTLSQDKVFFNEIYPIGWVKRIPVFLFF